MESNVINNNCWVAYCDLLGFSEQINAFEKECLEKGYGVGQLDIFLKNFYEPILEELQKHGKWHPSDVFITWFSDSFLFFTRNDSKDTFTYLSGEVTDFCRCLIDKMWPFRAAIGFGQLYADDAKARFLGSGIVDAHDSAEQQNWIGLVVTAKASSRLRELGIDLSRRRAAFTRYPVPFKERRESLGGSNMRWRCTRHYCALRQDRSRGTCEELFVARIHHQAPYIRRAVEVMQREAMDKYKEKAENTLKFFQSCP